MPSDGNTAPTSSRTRTTPPGPAPAPVPRPPVVVVSPGAGLVSELAQKALHQRQYVTPGGSEGVRAPGARAGLGLPPARQPAPRLHPLKHWIEGARAHAIAVLAQLLEHPVADDGVSGRVVENVDLPEAEEDLPPGMRQMRRERRAAAARLWHERVQYHAFRYRIQ